MFFLRRLTPDHLYQIAICVADTLHIDQYTDEKYWFMENHQIVLEVYFGTTKDKIPQIIPALDAPICRVALLVAHIAAKYRVEVNQGGLCPTSTGQILYGDEAIYYHEQLERHTLPAIQERH